MRIFLASLCFLVMLGLVQSTTMVQDSTKTPADIVLSRGKHVIQSVDLSRTDPASLRDISAMNPKLQPHKKMEMPNFGRLNSNGTFIDANQSLNETLSTLPPTLIDFIERSPPLMPNKTTDSGKSKLPTLDVTYQDAIGTSVAGMPILFSKKDVINPQNATKK